ncbi:hypothetical protein IT570_02680 [Candidatus Sumerlaeota bacterium]|nr:hypothetical protein [Candidatus Sumerlaeota bacterium]
MKRIPAVTILAALASVTLAKSPDSIDLKTDRVVVFKDGYGLFMKKGKAHTDESGRVFTNDVPRALLGTLWASSADGTPVGVRAELVESVRRSTETFPATSMQDLLRANVGGEISVTMEKESLEGTLKQLVEPGAEAKDLEDRVVTIVPDNPEPALDPYNASYSARIFPPLPTPSPARPSGEAFAVIVGKDGKTHVIAVRDIKSLSGTTVKTEAPAAGVEAKRTKRLTFEFGNAAANKDVEINLLYLQEGVQWVPSYRLDGDLKQTATMALQGELINEAEDIEGASVDLVVGVPNFKFNDRVSPLALDRELRRTLTTIDRGMGNNALSNRILNSQMAYVGGDGGGGAQPGIAGFFDASMDTQAGQDLFFYNARNVSLKKGGRMMLPLWSSGVTVGHCYRFNVDVGRLLRQGLRDAPMQGGSFGSPASPPASPLEVSRNEVWHIVEMKNETQTPWTTGAALVLQEGMPISQDVLAYTSPGGTGSLPITVAVDVRGEFRDEESARKQSAFQRNGAEYDRITKRGTITLTNYRKEESKVQVNVSVGGKVTTTSDGGTIRLNDYRAGDWGENQGIAANQHSDVHWELALQPGEKKEITYNVEFFGR